MRTAIILLILLLAGSVSLTAQQTDAKPKKGRGNLNGLVVNDMSRSERWGISGATIILTKRGDTLARGQTTADGIFVMDSLEPGRYRMQVSHPQYYSKHAKRIKVKSIGRTSLMKKPIVLHFRQNWNGGSNRRNGTLPLRATEKIKNVLSPVDSVLVSVKTMSDSLLQVKMTDKQGNVLFSLPAGQYKIVITRPGYQVSSSNVAFEENKDKTMATMVVRVTRRKMDYLGVVLAKRKKQKEVVLVPVKDD